MDKEEKVDDLIWQAVQQRVGYTDAELAIFKKRKFPHKMLRTSVINNVLRTNVIFEVVKSSNCNVGHKVGDKIYFNAEGYMITRKCPDKICPAIMPFMTRMIWLIQERLFEGLDPQPLYPCGHCDDVGVDCGGMGQVLLETKTTSDEI